MSTSFARFFKVRREFLLYLVVLTVAAHGLFVLATTLLEQIAQRNGSRITAVDIDIPLLIGLGLIYLSTLLRRRKQTAWVVALLVYMFTLGFYAKQIAIAFHRHEPLYIAGRFIIPLAIIFLLLLSREMFTVKSDIRSFGFSLRVTAAILAVTFAYGTIGFSLMDRRDFHQEISVTEAMHRTIDQFGLTTSNSLQPQTKRARLFVDSLSVISIGAVVYAAISLFQPIRSRVTSHHDTRAYAERLLKSMPGNSEDFFKLWPADKAYFFDKTGKSGLAYKVQQGVALVVGDPFGDQPNAKQLLREFEDLCYSNDWLPVFVHTEPQWSKFYHRHGYTTQKIGEEAIVELEHFNESVRRGKYFRQISNKFAREGFTTEVFQPPHDKALVSRLKTISNEWLSRPGRAERGFMMGYFTEEYMQRCPVVVARDSAGTIQAFINQIPSYDKEEANFDLLRHAHDSPGNINDFVLMAFIDKLGEEQYKRLNLGLCPLAGLEDLEEKSAITRTMQFLYSNGDRFYSFSGLHRFKAKYEPEWSDRYVVYKGGIRNFIRAMNTLTRAMRVKRQASGKKLLRLGH